MLRVTTETDTQILGLFGKYRPLSNYDTSTFCINDITFPSGEHAFHYYKVDDETQYNYQREDILNADTPKESKALGRKCKMRSNWDEIKNDIMYNIQWHKFIQNEHLKKLLLSTGDKYIEETNDWNDTYWGVCNGNGQNNLGKILMQVRANIRDSLI